jgi:hypothetical protein
MRATAVIMQTFNRTGQVHIELAPSSVYAIAIYIFVFGIFVSLFNIVKVLRFPHVELGTYAAVSTCAALLLSLLLTNLTLTRLARHNGLRSLVGLTMRLATNSA